MANLVPNSSSPAWRQRFGKQMLVALVCVVLCFAILAIAAQLTAQRIARNDRAWFEAQINALVPSSLHDNDLLVDKANVLAPEALGSRMPVSIYRARLKGTPTAIIINSVAPDGYGGPIELLVAINYAGEVLGVRVLAHHETPGMGDAFAQLGSTWLPAFRGRSFNNTEPRRWNVRKDGGDFEQFTSATISPRAIVHAVQRTLDYYQSHRSELFNLPIMPTGSSTSP